MASVGEKLYPPTIGSSIPAFYAENGTAKIAVPFSMNRAVSDASIVGFRLKIKTVQSNTLIKILDCYEKSNSLTNRVVNFFWSGLDEDGDFEKIRLGQYLKVQMAYLSQEENNTVVGYFSTVGIIKYTSKPICSIKMDNESNLAITPTFRQTYIGIYETTEDKSERPYSYCFNLYNASKGLVETSGWRVHNTTINNVAKESLQLTESIDTYTFQTMLPIEELHYIQYSVKTINNLQVSSPMYSCMQPDTPNSSFGVDLVATNVFEEAYVELSFQLKDGYTEDSLLDEPISIEICRASKLDNYESWQLLKRKYIRTYAEALNWTYKDFTIEQGITYKYCFRQYTANGIQSGRTESQPVIADFEDMFLLGDGNRQLKIRFNPKVSSFKTTRFEQKIDTIGSKYPFIFRNGIVSYKEFPISGLISYLTDNHQWMMKAKDLGLIADLEAKRRNTPVNQEQNDTLDEKSWERSETLNSVAYNMRAERIFKLHLLEWLGDGQIKLFKSPQEGNYLVRLLNISLTPEDRVGRMLHSFSCTAYEVEEINYENLLNLGFIDTKDEEENNFVMETIKFVDKIREIPNLGTSVKINNSNIYNYLRIEYSPNVQAEGQGFYIRMGQDSAVSNKVLIRPEGLIINSGFAFDSQLSDIFFNINDNLDLLREINGGPLNLTSDNLNPIKALCESLVGDSELTYYYNATELLIGDFNHIQNIYVRNEISTYIGPNSSIRFQYNETSAVLRFFVLDFKKKQVITIKRQNGEYMDLNSNPITHFDEIALYRIQNDNSLYYYKNGSLTRITSGQPDTTITLTDIEDTVTTFEEPPKINLDSNLYKKITIGNGIYFNCAYQIKITEIGE